MQITFSERELEDFLCKDKNLEKYLGLKFIARQVNIFPAGIVDILAYDKLNKSWVVIELKRDKLDVNALVQGMSYLKYYKTTKSLIELRLKKKYRERKFSLLLIGSFLDQSLTKVVDYIGSDEIYEDGKIYYKLFDLSFEGGVSFDSYDIHQDSYNEKLLDIASRLEIDRFYSSNLS